MRGAWPRLAQAPERRGTRLLATGRYIGEGFDDPRLDTLFLTLPVSWRGTIAQYVGRLHRLHDGKREVRVYDYADLNVPMLARMFDRRCQGYEAVGYTILLPASAVPGWPAEVPLPDRSGVEARLRRQRSAADPRRRGRAPGEPVRACGPRAKPGAEGVDRARSATEAFLYRRLETLAATAGRFHLNAELPIPFDNGEDGGGLPLRQPAWRSNWMARSTCPIPTPTAGTVARMPLQENGYFVLRFLAEDVGKRLDDVLDAILRTLAHQSRTAAQ